MDRRAAGWIGLTLVLLVGSACRPLAPSSGVGDNPPLSPTPVSEPAQGFSPEIATPEVDEEDHPVASPIPSPEPVEETMLILATPAGAHANSVKLAKADLARRLDVDVDQIQVLAVEEVVWRDSSLGCPQPGMFYTQAWIDGILIRLQVGDSFYDYHGGGDRAPFLCTSKGEVLPEDLGGRDVDSFEVE